MATDEVQRDPDGYYGDTDGYYGDEELDGGELDLSFLDEDDQDEAVDGKPAENK
ncbi:MAG TPA: hypothetical protein VI322_03060 [Candidatus Saccharimonadia bacterium]